MKIQIVYHSDSGNTKKLATAISDELGIPAEEIKSGPKIEGVDLLFVGGSWRAFNLERNCKSFLKDLSTDQAKNVALFSTSASGKGIAKFAEKLLKGKEIHLLPMNAIKRAGQIKKQAKRSPAGRIVWMQRSLRKKQ